MKNVGGWFLLTEGVKWFSYGHLLKKKLGFISLYMKERLNKFYTKEISYDDRDRSLFTKKYLKAYT